MNHTPSKTKCYRILRSNLRGRHFLAKLDGNCLDTLLEDMGLLGEDLEAVKSKVAEAKQAILEAHSDHETKAVVAKWRETIILITSNNPVYRTLDMMGQDVGDDGVELMADAVRQNCVIVRVDLSGNGISHLGAPCIEKLLRHNSSITHLDLGANKLGAR